MASLFGQSDEERTEAPTQFRREEFRRQGTVAVSRELLSVAVLIAVGISLYYLLAVFHREFRSMSEMFFGLMSEKELTKERLMDLRLPLLRYFSWMAGPVFLVAVFAGGVACLAQVGFVISWEPLTPSLERLNPISGFGKIFSVKGGAEAFKAIIKLFVVSLVVYFFMRDQITEAGGLFSKAVPESLAVTQGAISNLFFAILFSLLAIAMGDYLFQRFQLEKQMRMTKREAKEEFKLREGDPLIKARIKGVQRRLANRRMMDDVPKADVIVTNPTHLAIALKYDPEEMHAPRVIAKGADHIAQKIKEVARFHQIPVVENKPLARSMFKLLDVNDYIPRDLYKAVAEVLSYVYRLKGRLANG